MLIDGKRALAYIVKVDLVRLTLGSLHPRINLSPFTKDFRGEEQYNESIDKFL